MPVYAQGHGAGTSVPGEQHVVGTQTGREVIQQIQPRTRDVISATIRAAGTGNLAAAISGAPKGTQAYRSAQRTLQRWANGATPKPETLDRARALAAFNTGTDSAALDRIAQTIANGGGPLPDGRVTIRLAGTLTVHGSQPDTRDRGVSFTLTGADAVAALLDPVSAWQGAMRSASGYPVTVDALDMIEITFTPESEEENEALRSFFAA